MSDIKMDAQRKVEIMEKAIATFGVDKQVDIAIEEMSELTKALLKLRRCAYHFDPERDTEYAKEQDHVREEMADVSIMLSQLELIYGGPTDYEAAKLERLEKRIEDYRRDMPERTCGQCDVAMEDTRSYRVRCPFHTRSAVTGLRDKSAKCDLEEVTS